jgi:hypothetical protein
MSSVMRAFEGARTTVQACSTRYHILGRPLAEDQTGVAVGVVPRQRAVEALGALEVREAERVEAPGVFGRVAGGLVFVDGARARGAHGLDEAALEAFTWVSPSAALSPERRFFFGFSEVAPSVSLKKFASLQGGERWIEPRRCRTEFLGLDLNFRYSTKFRSTLSGISVTVDRFVRCPVSWS